MSFSFISVSAFVIVRRQLLTSAHIVSKSLFPPHPQKSLRSNWNVNCDSGSYRLWRSGSSKSRHLQSRREDPPRVSQWLYTIHESCHMWDERALLFVLVSPNSVPLGDYLQKQTTTRQFLFFITNKLMYKAPLRVFHLFFLFSFSKS